MGIWQNYMLAQIANNTRRIADAQNGGPQGPTGLLEQITPRGLKVLFGVEVVFFGIYLAGVLGPYNMTCIYMWGIGTVICLGLALIKRAWKTSPLIFFAMLLVFLIAFPIKDWRMSQPWYYGSPNAAQQEAQSKRMERVYRNMARKKSASSSASASTAAASSDAASSSSSADSGAVAPSAATSEVVPSDSTDGQNGLASSTGGSGNTLSELEPEDFDYAEDYAEAVQAAGGDYNQAFDEWMDNLG